MKRSAIGIAALAVMLVVTWGVVNGADDRHASSGPGEYTVDEIADNVELRRALVFDPSASVLWGAKPTVAPLPTAVDTLYPTWTPQVWGLGGPARVVGVIGEIVDVPFYWEAMPDSAINMFYRAGVQCDSTLRIVDVVPGPDASDCFRASCLTVNVLGNTQYDAIWLDCGPSSCTNWVPFSGVIAILKVQILTGTGNIWIETTAGAGLTQPYYYNMNHVFPTRYYWTQNYPTGPAENPCTKPWAYATTPEAFNGPDTYHPCVSGIVVGNPIPVLNLEDIVAVEAKTWSNMKGMYR